MKLYHGTNQEIEAIDLSKGLKHKDFGQGFYLTPELETAQRMAKKRARLFGGNATIIEYEYDEAMAEGLNVKVFPEKATAEWARFVDRNRDRKQAPERCEYDIVSGPIADDGVPISWIGITRVRVLLRKLLKDCRISIWISRCFSGLSVP